MELTGGCLCKAVRYRTSEAPRLALSCWCRDCQYLGAGSGTVSALFRRDALTVEGELRDCASTADSGGHVLRRFCPQCGTHLLATSDTYPSMVFLRLGTLDDSESVRPTITMWTASAPSWAPIDQALPRMERQPPSPAAPAR